MAAWSRIVDLGIADLSIETLRRSGAEAPPGATVHCSVPLPFYVENFLGFPVGMSVPLGSYDLAAARWVPTPNGRVLRVVNTTAAGRKRCKKCSNSRRFESVLTTSPCS